jgi:hypothetical protein
VRHGPQDLEGAHEVGGDHHDGPGVVELAAVVGRREDGQQLPVGLELVAILHHLVRAADQVQPVPGEEVRYYVVSECVRYTSA